MEIYHVLNRGVDKRKIYLDDRDYLRFIHDLFEFNDTEPVTNVTYFFQRQSMAVGQRYIQGRRGKRLVDILAFCLMPNHYHLLIQARSDDGLPQFMKKLNGGYAQYFNLKYKRVGTLFQGRYKSVRVKEEAHFIHLPYYIHLNPLDLIAPEWRDQKLRNYKGANKFLESYRWSSHLDYLGKKNFPSVTQREFLLEYFHGTNGYRTAIRDWLHHLEVETIKNVLLE